MVPKFCVKIENNLLQRQLLIAYKNERHSEFEKKQSKKCGQIKQFVWFRKRKRPKRIDIWVFEAIIG